MRVLIVEDEQKIAASIAATLTDAGYVPEVVNDGKTAWFQGSTESYVAAILDIGLPAMDGLSVLRAWRREGNHMPVLLLTAKGSWPERVEGIDAGADDYLVKPFHMEELLARLNAIVRRSGQRSSSVFNIREVTIDTRQMRVTENGMPVRLTPMEFRVLSYLLLNSDRVVTQEELATNVYIADQEPSSNAIEVTIGRLRRKFATNLITTKRGFGYHIELDPQ